MRRGRISEERALRRDDADDREDPARSQREEVHHEHDDQDGVQQVDQFAHLTNRMKPEPHRSMALTSR